jgi:hypothetical protein
MSQRIGNIAVICPEPEDVCQLCGAFAELRPYGPNGERICYDCGMKDEPATNRKMNKVLFGDKQESVQ